MAKVRPNLLTDPVGPTLRTLTGPMILGILAILLFNAVDTFFVARLGAEELAAIGFTFPVVFLVNSLSFGLGAGASAVISRSIGRGDMTDVRRLTTHGLLLAALIVVAVATLGFWTIEPLFLALGATPELLPLIEDYMSIWYVAVGFIVVPMVGNSAIRATGDTTTPSRIMMVAAGTNLVLDPLLIFGIGPFPRMEMAGAALATAIAFATTLVASLYVLHGRLRLLCKPEPSVLWENWGRILVIGLPAALTAMLNPISAAWVTRQAASISTDVVAAIGVVNRIEALAIVGIAALSSVIVPFMGQNLGANARGRIREGFRYAMRFSFLWGTIAAGILFLAAPFIARAFSPSEPIQDLIVLMLRIVPITLGIGGWVQVAASASNGLGNPRDSVRLNLIRLIVLLIPLSTIGALQAGVTGLFLAIATTNVVSGWYARRLIAKRVDEACEQAKREAAAASVA